MMEIVLGLMIGLGLSAACGFRVFVPLLAMSIANHSGHLALSTGFEWIGTWPALVAFSMATLLEVGAYCIPWLDNLLDTAASPVAVVAATIITASQLGDVSPLLKWSLAVIAGGGICGAVQAGTVTLRAASTATTGGLGNPLVALFEFVCAGVFCVLAIVLPLLAMLILIAAFGVLGTKLCNSWFRKSSTRMKPVPQP